MKKPRLPFTPRVEKLLEYADGLAHADGISSIGTNQIRKALDQVGVEFKESLETCHAKSAVPADAFRILSEDSISRPITLEAARKELVCQREAATIGGFRPVMIGWHNRRCRSSDGREDTRPNANYSIAHQIEKVILGASTAEQKLPFAKLKELDDALRNAVHGEMEEELSPVEIIEFLASERQRLESIAGDFEETTDLTAIRAKLWADAHQSQTKMKLIQGERYGTGEGIGSSEAADKVLAAFDARFLPVDPTAKPAQPPTVK